MGIVIAFMIVIFFREKPPTAPSPSATDANLSPSILPEGGLINSISEVSPAKGFKPAMKQLFGNKIVILLMAIFGFIQGVFNTMGTVIGEIAAEYDFKPVRLAIR